jgi:hypothetical protein
VDHVRTSSVVGFELFHTSVTGPRPRCGEGNEAVNTSLALIAHSPAAWSHAPPVVKLTSHPQDFACIPPDFNFEVRSTGYTREACLKLSEHQSGSRRSPAFHDCGLVNAGGWSSVPVPVPSRRKQ